MNYLKQHVKENLIVLKNFQTLDSHQLIWHKSRTTNLAGIPTSVSVKSRESIGLIKDLFEIAWKRKSKSTNCSNLIGFSQNYFFIFVCWNYRRKVIIKSKVWKSILVLFILFICFDYHINWLKKKQQNLCLSKKDY